MSHTKPESPPAPGKQVPTIAKGRGPLEWDAGGRSSNRQSLVAQGNNHLHRGGMIGMAVTPVAGYAARVPVGRGMAYRS